MTRKVLAGISALAALACASPVTIASNGDTGDGGSCPSGTVATGGLCCPMGSGNSLGICCPMGASNSAGVCCAASTSNSNGLCCATGTSNVNGLCCPLGTSNSNGLCCATGTSNVNGLCCPAGTSNSSGLCCPAGTSNSTGVCCPAGSVGDHGLCCPIGTSYVSGLCCPPQFEAFGRFCIDQTARPTEGLDYDAFNQCASLSPPTRVCSYSELFIASHNGKPIDNRVRISDIMGYLDNGAKGPIASYFGAADSDDTGNLLFQPAGSMLNPVAPTRARVAFYCCF
jgi:hypothetical protein